MLSLVSILLIIAIGAKATDIYNSSDVGVWEGDLWIPPGGKLYNMTEMFDILKDRVVMVMGDSLGRRLCSTTSFLLMKYSTKGVSDTSEVALDRDAENSVKTVGHKDNAFDTPTRGLLFEWTPLLSELATKSCAADNLWYANATDIVIDVGNHDGGHFSTGGTVDAAHYHMYLNATRTTLSCLTRSPEKRIFWRTAPYAFAGATKELMDRTLAIEKEMQLINKAGRTACAEVRQCVIVDAEKLLESKSMGADRLAGDTSSHYNSLARLTIVQLLLRAMVLTGPQ